MQIRDIYKLQEKEKLQSTLNELRNYKKFFVLASSCRTPVSFFFQAQVLCLNYTFHLPTYLDTFFIFRSLSGEMTIQQTYLFSLFTFFFFFFQARTTSFIVLVPLIVFCARCIIGASYARIFGTSKLETVNKPEGERHKFRSGHWRSALRDIRELDGPDSESSIDSTVSSITSFSYSLSLTQPKSPLYKIVFL